ncbi:MAG: peptidase S10 [Pseudomonadota bacterium]
MRHRIWRAALSGGVALAALAAPMSPALAQAAPAPAEAARKPVAAVTRHVGRFNGETVRYTATVSEAFLKDDKGAPAATVTTIAYLRDGVKDRASRPVMFVFNGGPGASSSPLHMGALGPAIRTTPTTEGGDPWKTNGYSPLDAVDLVFIDPVGTGFSRPFQGADTKAWYSRSGDAVAIKSVIRDWLKANGREDSPRYLAGESYGTTRAAMMFKVGEPLRFDGVLLIALVGDASGREMPYVASLPTMAAGAWRHERIDRAGRTVDQVYAEALEFARTDYLAALVKGSSLPADERRRIAERMAALIGLPVGLILKSDLRIEKNTWMFNLLKDQGLRTGLLDVQVTAPLEPGQDGAIDDPALGVVPKRAPGAPAAPPPSPMQLGAIPSPAVGAYMTRALKYPSTETYYGVNFKVNAAWDYDGENDANLALGKAMVADPKMRLFWAAGYYDLTTPAYAARYTLDQSGIPEDRLTAAYFAGPHGVYDGEDNLRVFTDAVRGFVTAP